MFHTIDCPKFLLMRSVQDGFVKDLCLLVFALFQVAWSQIVHRFAYVWIIWAEFLLIDFQSSLIVFLHLLILTLNKENCETNTNNPNLDYRIKFDNVFIEQKFIQWNNLQDFFLKNYRYPKQNTIITD